MSCTFGQIDFFNAYGMFHESDRHARKYSLKMYVIYDSTSVLKVYMKWKLSLSYLKELLK